MESWPALPAWLPLVLINTSEVCHPLPNHGESQWVLGWAATCLLRCNDTNKGAWQGPCEWPLCVMWWGSLRDEDGDGGWQGQTEWLILTALPEGGRNPARDTGGLRGGRWRWWDVGDSQVVQPATPPWMCLYHHDNWDQRVSRDPVTPGEGRKHHLHFAHSTAHHSRLTWFMQSADMLHHRELWSRPALLFSARDKTACDSRGAEQQVMESSRSA